MAKKTIISREGLEFLIGAVKNTINIGDIINNEDLADNKTYSNIKIEERIDDKIDEKLADFAGGGGSSSEKQIKDWVSGDSYLVGDYIYYEGEIYRCLTSNSDVDFDETNWKQLTYGIDKINAKLGEKASKEEIKNFKNVHTSPTTLGITIVNGEDNTRKAFDALGVGERYQDFWTNSPAYLRWGIPEFYGNTVQIEIVKISSNYGVCTATTDKGITLQRYIDASMTKMLEWERLCNTTVADVPRTRIVSENTNVILNSNCVYRVVNGVCYVSLWDFQCTSAGLFVVNSSMPKTKMTMQGLCTYDINGYAGGCAYILYDGNDNNTLYVKALATQPLYCSFSYPVS